MGVREARGGEEREAMGTATQPAYGIEEKNGSLRRWMDGCKKSKLKSKSNSMRRQPAHNDTLLYSISLPHHHHQLTVQLNGLWCAIDQSINLIIYCVLSYSQSDTSHNHWQTLVDTETCC